MLAVACNDSKLLAMLTQSIKLICESSLKLLARNVGQLSLGDEGLGLGTDEFLLQDNNLGRVGFLVLELCNLVRDLLLPYARPSQPSSPRYPLYEVGLLSRLG